MSNPPVKNTRYHWGDWLACILLVIIMQIAAGRLAATLWTKDLNLIRGTAFLGTILGFALGKSIFKRFLVLLFAFTYGLAIIPWQLGLTLDKELDWTLRVQNLYGRLGAVISEVFSRSPVTDNLLFLLLMALLFWVLTVHAGYVTLREGNPWKAILPTGVAIFVIHSFDPLLVSRSWYLAFYLFFALVFVARLVYLKNSNKWKESRTHTPPDMGFDFSRVALVLSMVLVFFAWNVPVLAESFKPAAQIWQTTTKPWLSTKDRLGFMFASLRASVGLVDNFYHDTLALGIGTPLSDQVVMEVRAPTDLPNDYRFYWEARSYNTYNANYWTSTNLPLQNLSAESDDIKQPGKDVRPLVLTTFYPHSAISNLFAPPEPLWLNVPTQVHMATAPDGTVDFEAIMSKSFVRPGEQYTVRSAIDAMTVSDLKKAGTNYPQWVLDEYLQLPNNITLRTRQLASSIASGLSNPYDITNAVTEYLRQNIEYTQNIDPPPANQERVDWFLFDYRKGFCNYYASAEVVLLRSLGIPARMAVGFAEGERQLTESQQDVPSGVNQGAQGPVSQRVTYVVRQKDAHAWPEVFFPGIGWVIFEPTVSQPELVRPAGEAPTAELNLLNPNLGDPSQRQDNPANNKPDGNQATQDTLKPQTFWTVSNIIKSFFLLFALAIIGFVSWQVRRGFKFRPFFERASIEIPERLEKSLRRMGFRPPEALVNWVYYHKLPGLSRSYMEINHALARLGKKPAVQDTPSERTASLIRTIPEAAAPAERLLREYQTSIYTTHHADPETARKAGSEIRKQSWIAKIKQLLSRLQESDRDRKKYRYR